jgi:heme A synthase
LLVSSLAVPLYAFSFHLLLSLTLAASSSAVLQLRTKTQAPSSISDTHATRMLAQYARFNEYDCRQ